MQETAIHESEGIHTAWGIVPGVRVKIVNLAQGDVLKNDHVVLEQFLRFRRKGVVGTIQARVMFYGGVYWVQHANGVIISAYERTELKLL